jgi:4-hydroxy-4-methyl-2-oxoglutarate aldolase
LQGSAEARGDKEKARVPSKNEAEPAGPAIIAALRAIDTATLYESAAQPGFMGPEIRPIDSGLRIAGPALTVACPAGDNLMLHAALAEARPGEILVVQCHDASYGVWGEILMTSAMARGVAGLVIDGAVRDVEALRAAGFPVFCRALAVRGAAKKKRGILRQPVSCGGVLVFPGDYVIADDSGVVIIAPEEIEQVLNQARQRQSKETEMMAALQARRTTVDLLGLDGTLEKLGFGRAARGGSAA